MRRILLLVLPVTALACVGTERSTSAEAETLDSPARAATTILPPGVEWGPAPPSLPPGARIAVLEGDPRKAEPFTMRALLPNDYRVPPHSHPSHERITVISGTFQVGMGDTFNLNGMEEVGAGGFKILAPGMNHYVRVVGETVIQVHGTGPWQVNYVNPADDPSRK